MKEKKCRIYVLTVVTAVFMILCAYGIHAVTDGKIEDRVVKTGFVYVGDASTGYTGNFMKAQNEIEKIYAGQIETFTKYNVAEEAVTDALDELIAEGCELIFTNSYGFGEKTKEYAGRYPDVQFCQSACNNADESPVYDNYHTFMGEIYQGRYISGVIAGMKMAELIEDGTITKEQAKAGYVGAYPNPEVISGYTAFILGIRSVVPEAVMTVRYTDSWENYHLEKECAKKLIKEGCVVISQHSDTAGPAAACEETDSTQTVYYVSYNDSMSDIAPTTYLTGTKINWEPYMQDAVAAVLSGKKIESCVNGHIFGNDTGAGFESGWVEMLEMNEFTVADGSRERAEELIEAFKKHKIKVFYGDYTGTDPSNLADTIDLNSEYQENKNSSAPTFHYILDDVVTVETDTDS